MKNRKFLFAVTFVIAGATISAFLLPLIFPIIPNENIKYFYIKEFLTNNKNNITTIFLGNSVVQNGIDAKYYSKLMAKENFSVNFATSGQSIYEGLVLLDSAPKPQEVIWSFRAADLEADPKQIPANRINSLYMNDYFPSKKVMDILRGNKTYIHFNKPSWKHFLDARWAFQSSTNYYFRRLLRNDLKIDKASKDMFYPAPYKRKVTANTLFFQLNKVYKQNNHFTVARKKDNLLRLIGEYLTEKKIRFFVVLAPEHPFAKTKRSSLFYKDLTKYIESYLQTNITVWNFSQLLEENDFIDHIHPTKNGARKFTRALVTKVKEK